MADADDFPRLARKLKKARRVSGLTKHEAMKLKRYCEGDKDDPPILTVRPGEQGKGWRVEYENLWHLTRTPRLILYE